MDFPLILSFLDWGKSTMATTWKRSFVKEFLWIQVLHTLNLMVLLPRSRNLLNLRDQNATMLYTILWCRRSIYGSRLVRPWSRSKRRQRENTKSLKVMSEVADGRTTANTYAWAPRRLCITRIRENGICHVNTFSIGRWFGSRSSPTIRITIARCNLCY